MQHPVDFFIVGEPKSGTTALAYFLAQHRDIGISTPKEPHYFATDLQAESDAFHGGKRRHFEVRTVDQYERCFDTVSSKKLWGEGSTHYMCSRDAARNIHEYNPQAKIIVMLRNPVDFLHSLHMQYVNNATEDEPDFDKALALEPYRKAGHRIPRRARCPSHLYYSERIKYAEHLARFQQYFPASQIRVIITEEFNADNERFYRDILQFLGADATAPLPEFKIVHGSKAPRSRVMHATLNNLALKNAVMRAVGPSRYDTIKNGVARLVLKKQARRPLDAKLRIRLMDMSRPQVDTLAERLGRDDLPTLWQYTDR